MKRPFTGWHMTTILVAMFGVIIAVNLIMASYAITTFSGTVVENSYVASQEYNRWLAQARIQQTLGWTLATSLDDARRLVIEATPHDGQITGTAIHPLGQAADIPLSFKPETVGRWRSLQPLPQGRWLIELNMRSGGHDAHYRRAIFR